MIANPRTPHAEVIRLLQKKLARADPETWTLLQKLQPKKRTYPRRPSRAKDPSGLDLTLGVGCEPCRERGQGHRPATRLVGETPMCKRCYTS